MANHSHRDPSSGTQLARTARYDARVMKRGIGTLAALLTFVLGGCGGAGGSSSHAPASGVTPSPTTAPATPQFVHRIIGFASGVKPVLETVPAGNAPALPPGARDLGVVAGAGIVYPDGSVQYADKDGGYDPSKSAFGQKYRTQLNSNAQLQPAVILTDPSNGSMPTQANISAYSSVQQGQTRTVAARRMIVGRPGSGTQTNVAGVVLLPIVATLVSGNILSLNAVGVDTNNNVVDISNLPITYTAQYGTVFQFSNSTQAYYLPPPVTAGQIVDTVQVELTQADGTHPLDAGDQITILAPANTASASGQLTSSGAPVDGGIAIFAQSGLPQYFMPSFTLASADSNGNYTTQLPANTLYSLGIGTGAGGSAGAYVAQGPNGSSSYHSLGSGASDTLNLSVAQPPVPFSTLPLALQYNLPSWVTFVRDAWYTGSSFSRRIFEASSGIQSLLASAPQTLSAPTPSSPAPIGSGQLAMWCYQWQPIGGVPTLVLIENTDTKCTQGGNEAYTVNGGSGSYQYAHYYSHANFQTSGTPDVVTGSLLVDAGGWSQSVTTDASGNIQTDLASISYGLYDELDQVFGQPVYNESLSYQYTAGSNGLSSEQFSNGQRTSAYDGTLVSSFSGTKTQLAAYSTCVGASTACSSVSASVQEDGFNYTVTGTHHGDGSRSLTYQSTASGDSSKVTLGVVSDAQSNTSGCLVCTTAPGTVYDTDGITPIATFTISNAGLVQVQIYDTPGGSTTPGPDVIGTLAFVL